MSGTCFVGMDVSQDTVDVAVQPGTAFQIANDDHGITEAVARVQAIQPTLIVLEATGGLEVPLGGGVGCRRPAGCRRQSTPGTRLCAGHRAIGQN